MNIEQIKADREAGTWGPWSVERRTGGFDLPKFPASPFLVLADDDCKRHAVADCSCNHTCRDAEECEANARRISRVPDLEGALIEAMDTLEAILKCTPYIADDIGDKIGFDCGDPYELARAFLKKYSTPD